MQIPNDEEFKDYLRRFQPVTPKPIPAVRLGVPVRRLLAMGALAVAVVGVLIMGTIVVHRFRFQVDVHTSRHLASPERRVPSELTVRSANLWLVTAPSFKAAIDDLAFGVRRAPIVQGKQSAITVLSEERIHYEAH